jgi:hypothetical protein
VSFQDLRWENPLQCFFIIWKISPRLGGEIASEIKMTVSFTNVSFILKNSGIYFMRQEKFVSTRKVFVFQFVAHCSHSLEHCFLWLLLLRSWRRAGGVTKVLCMCKAPSSNPSPIRKKRLKKKWIEMIVFSKSEAYLKMWYEKHQHQCIMENGLEVIT